MSIRDRCAACLVALTALLASPVTAETPRLEDVARQLSLASASMAKADTSKDRLQALGDAIAAYEDALASLRSGLRGAEYRSRVLTTRLSDADGRVGALTVALTKLGRAAEPMLIAHPDGTLAALRAGSLLTDVRNRLAAELVALRADKAELVALTADQQTAREDLRGALGALQSLRTDLLAERTVEDTATAASRIAGNATDLTDLALRLASGEVSEPTDGSSDWQGNLPSPVRGQLVRSFWEPDAAGNAKPGVTLTTGPRALVTAPMTASVRYAGPLGRENAQIVILEPQTGYLVILAGLAEVTVAPGDVVSRDAVLGLMGGQMPSHEEFLSDLANRGGAMAPESLYMEVRENAEPIDPAVWFTF